MIQEIAQSRITMIAFKNEWQAQWLANSSDLQKNPGGEHNGHRHLCQTQSL